MLGQFSALHFRILIDQDSLHTEPSSLMFKSVVREV